MRIVIDMQGAQSESRLRGIGRYSLSLAKAIVKNRGEHEIILVLNGLFPETVESLKEEFFNLLPKENIRIWSTPNPVNFIEKSNTSRRMVAEKIREAFLISLEPDIVLVSSLFEGLVDNAITSISTFEKKIPTATILYDLIPLINSSIYLDNPDMKEWYMNKIEHLKNSDLMLSISASSKSEAINYLGVSEDLVVNISTASESHFKVIHVEPWQRVELLERYNLTRPFVMYTGGIDYRKNIEGLIRAYAMLPKKLRKEHQLAIVCSIHDVDRSRLNEFAKKHELENDEVVFTGFVPEDHLIILYNLCKVFIFPSWHEGFGLPALEAMSCGKAVIAANTSSLPEVVGLEDALFDPRNDVSIANKLEQTLKDEEFRKLLENHGLKQAKKFSWEKSAQIAIAAFEEWQIKNKTSKQKINKSLYRLAYVSPLPPERSGISDYSAELLPELAKFYEIDVIVDEHYTSDASIDNNYKIRTVAWFQKNCKEFDRVIYHFGNSHFHKHMFELLRQIPGIVILHDFFLSGIIEHIQNIGYIPDFLPQSLFQSHGYGALSEYFHSEDERAVVWKYPANLEVLQNALGIVIHSDYSLRLAKQWYGKNITKNWTVIPLLRVPSQNIQREKARRALNLPEDAFVICSFGLLGPTKLNHRLLQAFFASSLLKDPKCYLIFVGEDQSGDYGIKLCKMIKASPAKERIKVTGWVDNGIFHSYLEAADLGVQLRTLSRGETSAAVLDCMNYGLATIVNANGTMADLGKDTVLMLPDDFTDRELVQSLEKLYDDEQYRLALGNRAKKIIQIKHNSIECAKQYFESIEKVYTNNSFKLLPTLIHSISEDIKVFDESELINLSQFIADDFPSESKMKQLFVDISELVQYDAKSGVQRVVRSLLRELIDSPPQGYRVEPVYADKYTFGYRYAREFMASFLDYPSNILHDEAIGAFPGDIFLGLDLLPGILPVQVGYLQDLYRRGISIHFVVYDLLPVLKPELFTSEAKEEYIKWLEIITKFDGALCISNSVANELNTWIQEEHVVHSHSFNVSWFHLGADIENPSSTKGISPNTLAVLEALKEEFTFLMVGTVEPRKGYKQVLEAFEKLWKDGINIKLVIVGKEGWLVNEFVKKLKNHLQFNKKLFWFDRIDDEYLEKLYVNSTCLIAASEGEGFGLPLIEASRKKLPIIARNIPVFKEVAGKYAYYFNNDNDPKVIADAVKEWLELFELNKHPKSDDMPWLTWKQSSEQLFKCIITQ